MAKLIQRKWDLKGMPNYFFGDDKVLYRIISPEQIEAKKLCLKNYSKGYYFNGSFMTLTKLRTLLVRHVPENTEQN